jgi:putative colanic acid polymerase
MWALLLPLMQLSLGRSGNTDLTLGSIVALLLFGYLLFAIRYRVSHLLIACALITIVTSVGLTATNRGEFLASYVQLVGLISAIVISLHVPTGVHQDRTARFFLYATSLVAVLILVQFITWNMLSTDVLIRPFGPLAPLGPGFEVYAPNPLSAIKRPHGIFSEPSVAAWFMSFGFAVALSARHLIGRPAPIAAVVCGMAALTTMTLSGIINILVLSAAALWTFRRVSLNLVAIAALLGSIALILGLEPLVEFLAPRVFELFVEGTSSYYRVVAPVKLLSDSLPMYPLGHVLGDVGFIASQPYMVNWEQGSTTNIDNSFLLVAYYFGLPGLVIGIAIAMHVLGGLLARKSWSLVAIALVLAASETGALWAPHMALFLAYGVFLIRQLRAVGTPQTTGHRLV